MATAKNPPPNVTPLAEARLALPDAPSQGWVADRVSDILNEEVKQQAISNWEAGKVDLRRVHPKKLVAYAEVLGLTKEELADKAGYTYKELFQALDIAEPSLHKFTAYVVNPVTIDSAESQFFTILSHENITGKITDLDIKELAENKFEVSGTTDGQRYVVTVIFDISSFLDNAAEAEKADSASLHAASSRYPNFPDEEEEIDEALQEAGRMFGNMPEFTGIADPVTQRALQGIDFKHRPQTPQEWLTRFLKYKDDLPSSGEGHA